LEILLDADFWLRIDPSAALRAKFF